MEASLRTVTPEIRTSYLDLLANGEKVLEAKRSKPLPLLVGCIGVIVITAIVIYYESRLNEQTKLN